jgi:alcohol dehydrogenase
LHSLPKQSNSHPRIQCFFSWLNHFRQSSSDPGTAAKPTMEALIYNGVGKCKLVDKEIPRLSGGLDALVKMQRTTICGSDLHILKGDVPTCTPGRTLGHEGIGVIEEIGQEVKNFKKGDRVLIRCITCCGTCQFCKKR